MYVCLLLCLKHSSTFLHTSLLCFYAKKENILYIYKQLRNGVQSPALQGPKFWSVQTRNTKINDILVPALFSFNTYVHCQDEVGRGSKICQILSMFRLTNIHSDVVNYKNITLEAGIYVAPGINVAPCNFAKRIYIACKINILYQQIKYLENEMHCPF